MKSFYMSVSFSSANVKRCLFSFIVLVLFVEYLAAWKGIDNPCLCEEFRCTNGLCLHKLRVCDGYPDCPDKLDENPKNCKRNAPTNCSEEEFKCKFGGCIKLTQVCNKEIDCFGGVDEASDFCDWVNS